MTTVSPWRQARLDVVAEGFGFLEGPRWHDGRLYMSDFYGHRVLTVEAMATRCTSARRRPATPSIRRTARSAS